MYRFAILLATIASVFPIVARAADIRASGHLGAGIVHYFGVQSPSVSIENDLLDTPWLALNGTEAVGNGTQAMFKLSTSVNVPTGGFNGRFDDVYAGFDSPRWGRITIGRQYPAGIERVSDSLDVFEVSGSSLHVLPLALLATNPFTGYTGRTDNSVNYRWSTDAGTIGISAAAGEVAGATDSVGLALRARGCELGLAWLHYRGGAAAPGGVQYFGGAGGNCAIRGGRVYATLYDRSLRLARGGTLQRNLMVHIGVIQQVAERVTLTGGVYVDRSTALGCQEGRFGRKTTSVLALSYAFSSTTKLTMLAFANLMTNAYREDTLNAEALGATVGTAAVRGGAVTLGISF